jgi:hypothetical protein
VPPEADTYVIDLSDGGDRLDLAAEVASRHGGAPTCSSTMPEWR